MLNPNVLASTTTNAVAPCAEIWCRNPDSNWGPTHYECVALPTELLRHASKRACILTRGGLGRKAAGALVDLAKRAGQRKNHVFFPAFELFGHFAAPGAQLRDDPLHQNLGRRGTGRDPDGLGSVEPFAVQMLRPVDEISRNPGLVGHLAKPARAGAGLRSHHHQSIAAMNEVLNRILPVLGGVADIFLHRCLEPREAIA